MKKLGHRSVRSKSSSVLVLWIVLVLTVCELISSAEIIELRPNYVGIETTKTTTTTTAAPTTTAKRDLTHVQTLPVNLDHTPDTRLNLKLIYEPMDCNNTVQLVWYIFENTNSLSLIGFKIFVREYMEKPTNVTKFNAFNSKLINVNQNKFKLKNLLRNNTSYYLICLVVYSDTSQRNTRMYRLEKKCTSIILPPLDSNSACLRTTRSTSTRRLATTNNLPFVTTKTSYHQFLSTTSSTTEAGTTTEYVPVSLSDTVYNIPPASSDTEDHHLAENDWLRTSSIRNKTRGKMKLSNSNRTRLLSFSNGSDTLFQCKHYTNLLIAFVVSIALLTCNIFMFTVIIIQNAIKLNLLKYKIRLNKINSQFYCLSNASSSYSLQKNAEMLEMEREKKKNRGCCCRMFCSIWSCFSRICCDFSEMDASKAMLSGSRMMTAGTRMSNKNLQKQKLQQHQEMIKNGNMMGRKQELAMIGKSGVKKRKAVVGGASNLLHSTPASTTASMIANSRDGYILNIPNTYLFSAPSSSSAAPLGYPNTMNHPPHSGFMHDSQYPVENPYAASNFGFVNEPHHHPNNFSYLNHQNTGHHPNNMTLNHPDYRNFSNFSNEIFFHVPNRFRDASSAF